MNRLAFVFILAAATLAPAQADTVSVTSPDGAVKIEITSRGDRLAYDVTFKGTPVIERSQLGLRFDGVELGVGAAIRRTERYRVDERYPWRGVHAEAISRANGVRLNIVTAGGTPLIVDLRVQDDAVAFRFAVPLSGSHVVDAGSTFRIPAGSVVWSHGHGGHYEATYERRPIEKIPAGEWVAPPMTVKLPGKRGYVAITESDLRNYAGLVLQTDGNNVYRERLGHAAPANYPFTLRYGVAEASRLAQAAALDGPITTPWRVVMVSETLDGLVTSDVIHNLAAPPDPKLFPQGLKTPWVVPGRAVWRYLDGGDNTVAGIKEFSRLASELGFEYQVVEGQWQKWSEQELREVIDYSKSVNVRLLLWRHRNTLGDAVKRRELFAHLHKLGVAGLKVDFLDHEAKEVIDLYQAILRDAAEHQLLINFHGSNKPAGESRTWPNELTREGIYGLEHRGIPQWAEFNTTFPFVRMLAGHADYTPVVFNPERRKDTSVAHQIASAVILTSPLLVYGGHPASFLASPAVDMLKSIPSVWDETRVLPSSEIGALALFARRSGDRWFIAAMNGTAARTATLDLSIFGPGPFQSLIVRDRPEESAIPEVETRTFVAVDRLEVSMRPAGGFVVRLTPQPKTMN
jgi:alpha-glucosidase